MNIKNLDHDEVNKFDELAAKWWDKDGEFRPLHQINPLRVDFIEERSSMKDKKVLDVGCGGGILAEALSELGANVTGIDASENTIGVAKSHSRSIGSDVIYIQNTIEEYISSHPNEKFDVITCLEMLEHVPSPNEIIKSCSNLLKDDGNIFFSTINRNPRSYLFAVIGAEYILNLLPKGTHDYEKFIKPSELAKWIRDAGLNSKETIGLSYNPITGNYWLGKDIQVNYMVHAKKENI
jgi:2-polyprenyl-6-hydroxyphenyl methylase/3-demethylubiquinone-9 3-methyltransferase